MIYRTLAGEKVSQLGFGAMRLPMAGEAVDEKEAIRIMHHAMDSGLNYIDTAWVYHNGESEKIVGRALKAGYRHKAFVATKVPPWDIKKDEDFPLFLDKQLAKLGVDCIDFYLLHSLNTANWETCQKHKALEFCEKMKKAGKIRHFGFSFHDELPVFKRIAAAYDWEFCQIQYNYLDRKAQAGLEGFQFARARNIGVIVMEALRGGNLAAPVPQAVAELRESSPFRRSPVEWALGWVFNDKEAGLVLSGMSSMQQLVDNLAIAGAIGPESFTPAELALVDKTEELYRGLFQNNCTECRYCMPCPEGVDIPRNFKVWNEFHMFGKSPNALGAWKWVEASARADKCTQCGVCLELCPQKVQIPDDLKKVAADLGN